MKRLIEFSLENGTTILVETDQPESGGRPMRGARLTELAEKAEQTFESAIERVRPVAVSIISKLRDLSQPVDTVAVEFGIKLSAAAGAIVASAGSEANFKVVLTWKRQNDDGKA